MLLGLLVLLRPSLPMRAQSQPEALGSVGGTVRNAQGDPLPNITVSLQESPNNPTFRSDTTDAQGRYQLLSIPPGAYKVRYEDSGKVYAASYYANAPTWGEGEVVNVSGHEIAGIDGEMAPGGSISITTNLPLTNQMESLVFTLYRKTASGRWEIYSSLYYPNYPQINQKYLFEGLLSGTYSLCGERYYPLTGRLLLECYDNAFPIYSGVRADDATEIVINGGEEKVIALNFDDVSQISGIVRSSTGERVPGVMVTAITPYGYEAGVATTDEHGLFRFR